MFYTSTRGDQNISAAQAILNGIASDGGLYLPSDIPTLTAADFETLRNKDYIGRAAFILTLFLTDFSREDIAKAVNGAYGSGRFENDDPAPLINVHDHIHLLELWHGPTCAFKDIALQILPFFMTSGAKLLNDDNTRLILVATSVRGF